MTPKQNRSEVKEYYNLSNKLKEFGSDISISDIDTAENQYCFFNRGLFKIYIEFKAFKYKNYKEYEAPVIPYYQVADFYFNIEPSYFCYYAADNKRADSLEEDIYNKYFFYVVPANFAAVLHSGLESKILSEVDFQKFITKHSPSKPTIGAHLSSFVPDNYKYYFYYFDNRIKEKKYITRGELFYNKGFENIKEAFKKYGGEDMKRYKDAYKVLEGCVEDILLKTRIDAWKIIKKRAENTVLKV